MPSPFLLSFPILLLALYFNNLWPRSLHPVPPPTNPVVSDPTRNLTYIGTLSLSSGSPVEHFQSIFYAQSPTGPLRFAPPRKLSLARGSIIDATRPGKWCMQGLGDILPFTSRVEEVGEDCLSLRIARSKPTKEDGGLRPVMVWVHGGGHALGSAYEELYEPDGMVSLAERDGQPVVFVGINYRLGLFGFAASDALTEAGHTNVGLRDQRMAFEWVRDNIRAFGGDPDRVTAIGQSVGASDISLQLTAFGGTEGAPFSKAVMMSGAPGLNFNTKSDLVRNNTAHIVELVGCIKDEDAQSAATLTCLREVPANILVNVSVTTSRAARPPFGEGFFFPTFDGDLLPDRPSELVRAGRFAKNVSIIASWVANDGAWYASPRTSTDAEVLSSFGLWLHGHSSTTKSKLLELYPLTDFEHMVRPEIDGASSTQYYRAAQINRDLWFTCPVIDFAWQYLRHGGATRENVRLYEHNQTRFLPAYDLMGTPMWRVAHLSDIPYVFNNPHTVDNSESQLGLSKIMSRSIVRFAHEGNPEQLGIESWPPAFQHVADTDLEADFPTGLTLQLFGGPFGTAPVRIPKTTGDDLSDAQKAIDWEKLFERCEFINSDAVRRESGV